MINIDNWLSANRLILNTDKTHYMIFRTAKTKPPSNNLTLAIRNNFVSQQSKTFFFYVQYNFSYKTRISTTQYKTSVIKTKTDVYVFGIVLSGYR